MHSPNICARSCSHAQARDHPENRLPRHGPHEVQDEDGRAGRGH